jgi:hypothetical protein
MGKNHIKKVLKDVFARRDCFTLSLPSESLPLKHGSYVRKEFTTEVRAVAAVVKKELRARPKMLNAKELHLGEWVDFAKSLVELVNKQEKGTSLRL